MESDSSLKSPFGIGPFQLKMSEYRSSTRMMTVKLLTG